MQCIQFCALNKQIILILLLQQSSDLGADGMRNAWSVSLAAASLGCHGDGNAVAVSVH